MSTYGPSHGGPAYNGDPTQAQPPYPSYAQPQYGQPYAPPPAPKKRKTGRIVLIVIAAVVVVCIGGIAISVALGGGGGSSSSGSSGSSGNQAAGNQAVGMNQPARDGKFEFTVQSVQCGIASVGSSDFGKTAQGQYCEVHLTVKNIGDQAQLFDSSNQNAFNAAGQKYDADDEAEIYLGDQGNAFLNDINPGNAVSGTLIFDIPKNQKITKLELHDSAFSGGVTVNVS